MARLDHCPDAEPRRGENVALRAVRVMEQGDARRAVRVVLDRCDLRRHAILQALEVDDAVAPLVPAALVARRDPAVVVPAALLAQLGRERLVGLRLRDLLERGDGHETAARARRFVTTDRHRLNLCSLEDFDRVAGLQLDDCLLPARPPAADHPSALRLRLYLGDVHAHDLDVEELFDRLAHLGLVRVRMDAERVRVPALDLCVALLRDHGRQQDFVWMQAHQDAFAFTSSSASSVTSTERAHTSAATSSSPGLTTTTRSRFRNDLATFCSSFVTTTSGSSWPHSASRSAAVRVDGAEKPEPSTPPPVQCGARVVPARARPVPFWRHGFARPPDTRPRLLAARVPERRSFISARTVSWTTCSFNSAPKTSSSSVTSFDFLPAESSRGALGGVTLSPPGPRRRRSSVPARRL